MKQTVLCYGKNMTGSRFIKKMKNLCYEKNVYNERKGKCFPVLIKRKTLSFVKVVFSMLIRIKFSLTSFPCCCQTWENKESEFHFPAIKHALSVVLILKGPIQAQHLTAFADTARMTTT
jgi:hypothetical protein